MKQMTICTRCKWHEFDKSYYCYHPKHVTRDTDFVTGRVTVYPVSCSAANTKGKCKHYQEIIDMGG